MGAAAGTAAVGVAMIEGGEVEAEYLGTKLRLNVKDLGVLANGTGDDGARLTAGLRERFGTFATGPKMEPVEIDFGDLTLNLESPIVINQSYIEFMGSPKFFCRAIPNAIVVSAGGATANVFGTKIRGTILGHVEGDGVLYEQGTQGMIDIRNAGYIAQAVVHVRGSYRNDIRVHSDGENNAKCYYGYRESVKDLPHGPHNTINSNIFIVCYHAYGSGVLMEESQGFDLRGDIELAAGPGIDLVNCQNGLVSIYTEKNGAEASNTGYDTPDDIRIRSAAGKVVPNSDGIIVHASRVGGEQLVIGGQTVVPNSVHVIDAFRTYIEASALGGNIKIEGNSHYTTIGKQSRFLGRVIDSGHFTVDQSTPGRMLAKAGRYNRLMIDGQGPGGAMIGSEDNLLRLFGLSSFGTGTTLANNFTGFVEIAAGATSARVNFPVAERDAEYFPVVSLRDMTGGSAASGSMVRNLSPSGFDIVLDAAPGDQQRVRANYMIVRTA